MDLKLKDNVVIITAGTGGVGKELVKAFAAEGCYLAVTSTSQEKLDNFIPNVDIAPDHIKTYVVDMTVEAQVKTFIDDAAAHFGHIDNLIVNQGNEGIRALIEDADAAEWRHVFDVNVYGVLYAMKYAIPYMKNQGKGSIVVNCSDGAYMGSPGLSHYSASKHACYGLVKSATLELAPFGIHCNCICPGAIETPMIKRIESMQMPQLATREERIKAFCTLYPDRRYCQPEEVAYMALYLASEVSSHVNGSGIRLDGGMDAKD